MSPDNALHSGRPRVARTAAGIAKYDEVAAFFGRAASPAEREAAVDEIIAVVRPDERVIGLDLARLGYVELHGAKVREP